MSTAVAYPLTNLSASDLAPYVDAVAVTPNDSTDLQYITRGLSVGGAGTIKVNVQGQLGAGGVTFTVTAGQILPIRAFRVYATGTTVTGIVALY